MSFLKAFFVVIFFSMLVSCSSTNTKVHFDVNPDIDITSAKTFAWLKESKAIHLPVGFNPILKARIEKAIENEMSLKGYKIVSDASLADITLTYSVGSREKIKVDSYPSHYQGGFGWGHRYYGGYHGGYMTTETHVRKYTQGELAIDVYDVKSKQPAWHGWATRKITNDDKENMETLIQTIVSQTLASL
jgi:hypothetical protein